MKSEKLIKTAIENTKAVQAIADVANLTGASTACDVIINLLEWVLEDE